MSWSQIFLSIQFDGDAKPIEGEAEYQGFQGQIEIDNLSWGLSAGKNAAGGSGTLKQKPEFTAIEFSKRLDRSSMALFNRIKVDERIRTMVISVAHSVTRDDAKPRLAMEVKLVGARVISVAMSTTGAGKGLSVQENFTVHYERIYIKRFPITDSGKYATEAQTYQSRADVDLNLN